MDIFIVRVTLDVDADRDGLVEEDAAGKNAWEFGVGKKGAVILCNNDDDNNNTVIDNQNTMIDGPDDVNDLAPLIVRQSGILPSGVSLELSVLDQDKIRIFDDRSATGTAIIGPAPLPSEFPIIGSATADLELGMEATQYPDAGFSGLVRLNLVLKEGGTELAKDEVVVKSAPWMMPSHLNVTDELYVVEDIGFNDVFVSGIQAAATTAGVPLRRANAATYSFDQWMQDTMEIGYSHTSGKTIPVVLQAHRDRGLQHFARDELLNRDYGYTEESTLFPTVSPPHNTFDSHGNLEVSPPVTVDGAEYKFGRIYYGRGRPSTPFNPDVKAFLEAQLIQKPFDLDTDWLGVGHVDEIISFIPSNVGKNFRMLLASTDEAVRILTDLQTVGHGGLTLFTGKTLAYLRSLHPSSYDHFHERSIDDILADGALLAGNATCQARLDAVQTRLETELELDPATDIIKIPSLFIEEPLLPGAFAALIPGMVNLLVITGSTFADTQLVIPKPFGPALPASGGDQLEKDVRDKLTPLGYTLGQIRFIDDFDTYHINLGEVHCGT
ncbi:MAG: protein-arginine deiminase family protein, partial [Anaerolineales bacterium]